MVTVTSFWISSIIRLRSDNLDT